MKRLLAPLPFLRFSCPVIAAMLLLAACSDTPDREKKVPAKKETAAEKPEKGTTAESESKAEEKKWAVNELFGIRFETPRPIKEEQVDLPAGMEHYSRGVNAYTYADREVAVNFTAIEMIGDQYDTKGGLSGAAGNLVSHMDGTMKTLDFGKVPGEQNAHTCYGTFTYDGTGAELRGYSTFDPETHMALVMIGVGPADNRETTGRINRVFKSIEKTAAVE